MPIFLVLVTAEFVTNLGCGKCFDNIHPQGIGSEYYKTQEYNHD
jgi:hypothetical protein